MPDPAELTDIPRWPTALIDAVNADNLHPEVPCLSSDTYTELQAAPPDHRADVQPALDDFERAGQRPLAELRSDSVAAQFTVARSRPVALVARMTVPGGPWPGHYGLEAVVFQARRAAFPGWFPAISNPLELDFATLVAASAGFSAGTGAVLFPEQLSVRHRQSVSPFGLVFMGKLCELFDSAVLDSVADGTLGPAGETASQVHWLRELAFLAHEWGHLCVDIQPALMVARRRRAVAVLSEIHADLAAIDMLLSGLNPDACPAASVLVLDRVVREAWLPRHRSQVDSIAARQLLRWLLDRAAVSIDQAGRTRLDLSGIRDFIQVMRAETRSVEQSCSYDDFSPAISFLQSHGWSISQQAYDLGFDEPVAATIEQRALRARNP